jgi:predicted Rossmann fold flavoprotein
MKRRPRSSDVFFVEERPVYNDRMSSSSLAPHWDVVIAGGGPAGFFAAIRCAESNPQMKVLILERASQTLGKVIISGGGRCNVTHSCFDPAKLVSYYPRGGNELRGAFSRFQASDTVEWFESHGVRLKTEADGRIFPVTDSSETIAECLRASAKKAGVEVRVGLSLQGVMNLQNNGFRLEVRKGGEEVIIQTKKLVLATGSDRRTLEVIQKLGHSIEEPVPSLFAFNIKDPRIEGLAGVSVEDVTLKMESVVQRGPLLITHWGLSGPVVLRVSAWGARELHAMKYQANLVVNWLGDYSFEQALDVLQRNKDWKENTRKKVNNQQAFSQIPARLWRQLVQFIGEKNWADVSKQELRKLAEELTAGEFAIRGKGQFKEEFVTCGGVRLNEVDFKTMQSRLVENVFLAGEVLNIDGLTGGFNFQSAWSTGWLAGNALAQS